VAVVVGVFQEFLAFPFVNFALFVVHIARTGLAFGPLRNGLSPRRLKLKDLNTIVGGYDRCYCGRVKQTRQPFPTDTYCYCSTGWYKSLFEAAFGRPVKVKAKFRRVGCLPTLSTRWRQAPLAGEGIGGQ
jgi:hypothetical protein